MSKRLSLALLVLFGVSRSAMATDWPAASCSVADIQAVIDNASVANDDRILVPAGVCHWDPSANRLRLDAHGSVAAKALTLVGAGTESPINTNACTDNTSTATVICDDGSGNNPMIRATLVADKTTRITGFDFRAGTRASQVFAPNGGVFNVTGSNADKRRFRFDHNRVYQIKQVHIIPDSALGLVDNNEFNLTGTNFAIYIFNKLWDGGTTAEKAWDDTAVWGTAGVIAGREAVGPEAIYLEHNTFDRRSVTGSSGCIYSVTDGYGGGRMVFRYNTVYNGRVSTHGTESSANFRGHFSTEVYENDLIRDSACTDSTGVNGLHVRSGGYTAYNNRWFGYGSTTVNQVGFEQARLINAFAPWGPANGYSDLDVNSTQIETGRSVASFTSATRTVTVSGTPWSASALIGYVIAKTTAPCNVPITSSSAATSQFVTGIAHGLATNDTVWMMGHSGATTSGGAFVDGVYTVTVVDSTHVTLNGITMTVGGTGGRVVIKQVGGTGTGPNCSSLITSNTTSSLVFSDQGGYGGTANLTFTAGDTFDINHVTQVLDGVGRTGGSLMGAATGTRMPALPVGWNDQSNDPSYAWGNKKCTDTYTTGGSANCTSSTTLTTTTSGTLYQRVLIAGTQYYGDGTQRPGYTAYQDPHVLAASGSSTPPTITITSPTSASTYDTTSSSVSFGGTASDDVSVSSVTTANSTGDTCTATGTTTWSAGTCNVSAGANTLSATARDGDGQSLSATLRVYRTSVPATPADAFGAAGGWPTLHASLWSSQITGATIGINAAQQAYSVNGSLAFARYIGSTPANNQFAQVSLKALPSATDFAYVGVRSSGADATWNGFYCGANATQLVPIVITNGIASYATPADVTWSVIDSLRAECSGTTCVCKQSGTTRTTNTIVSPTSGAASIGVAGAMAVDDFAADDVSVSDTAPPTVVITTVDGRSVSANTLRFVTGRSPITIAGTASDTVGVSSCTYTTDRGQTGSLSGTTSPSGSITLADGDNLVTFDCADAAGNHGTDQITIRFLLPDPGTDLATARYSGGKRRGR